jgi:hypothetical protein
MATAPIWEQREEETSKAYAAFKIYRDLEPAKRTINAAWRAASQPKKGEKPKSDKTPGHFQDWYERHEWAPRAIAYDKYQRQIEEDARAEAQRENARKWAARVEEQRESEWQMRQQLLEKLDVMLKFPLVEKRIEVRHGEEIHEFHPANWRLRDVATFMLTASKVGRLATGQETEHILEIPWDDLSPEQLQRIADGEDPERVVKRGDRD